MERLTTLHHRDVPVVVVDYSGIKDHQESLDPKGVAVVGLAVLLRVIYLGMSKLMEMEMPAFDSRDEALDWLAELQ